MSMSMGMSMTSRATSFGILLSKATTGSGNISGSGRGSVRAAQVILRTAARARHSSRPRSAPSSHGSLFVFEHVPGGRRGRAISSSSRLSEASASASSASAVPSSVDDTLDGHDVDDDDDAKHGSSSSSSTDVPFLLADIGEGISEVEVLQWFVRPGDTVQQFDRICQVQSDKASVEITSRFDGTVAALCGEVGEMVRVGRPLLFLRVAKGRGPNAAEAASSNAADDCNNYGNDASSVLSNVDDVRDRLRIPAAAAADYRDGGSATADASKVLSSPAVRKLCKDHCIDLGAVMGTGPQGRVLKADVLKLIRQLERNESEPEQDPDRDLPQSQAQSQTQSLSQSQTVPLRGYHRLMVKSMTASLQIPHMVYTDEIQMDQLLLARDALRPLAKDRYAIAKLTLMPFFVKAASLALNEFPAVNAAIDVEAMTMTYRDGHDIGVAVDTEKGLAVPVVRRCQDKTVWEIAKELQRLLDRAMEGNLSEEDISNPTFTLSNIGAIGGTYMSPVVVPPQVAIGAMGRIQRLPRFVDDASETVQAVRIMPMSWGGDHRAIDGATMAKFSNSWKSYCENPSSMLFAMR